MSTNDQLPLFPDGDVKQSTDRRPAPRPVNVSRVGDVDEFAWIRSLPEHFQTSSRLGRHFGIAADSILRWADAGHFAGFHLKKGKRDIRLFNWVDVAKFLLKPESGAYRCKIEAVPLSTLKIDAGIYARALPSRQNCAPLISAVERGVQFLPYVVMSINGERLIVDGIRRHFAAKIVHGAKNPLVNVFVLPGSLSQARAFATTCDSDKGAGLPKAAAEYFARLVEDTPALKVAILSNKLKSPTLAQAFGLPRSTVDRCYRKLGWVSDRKRAPDAKSEAREAEHAVIETLRAIRRASDPAACRLAIADARVAFDAFVGGFMNSNHEGGAG